MVAASFDVFDCHQHMGTSADALGITLPGQVRGDQVVTAEVETRLRLMDEGGVRQAIAIPGHTYNRSEGIAATRIQNNAVAAYRDRNPDRFPVAAGIVEPLDEAAGLTEIERIADELRLKAVSFHTMFQGVTIDHPWVMRFVERMGELGLVPLIHASNVDLHEAIWRLGRVARAFSDLTIIAIEPFFSYEGMQECQLIADVAPNVVFETASCADTDFLIDLIHSWGSERFVFGSQQYSQVTRPNEDRAHDRKAAAIRQDIAATPFLTKEEKQQVLGSNARTILGMDH